MGTPAIGKKGVEMNRWFIIVFPLIVLFLVLSFLHTNLNYHPITMEYPFPQWVEDIKFLHWIDDGWQITGGFIWKKVKEKNTGNLYLYKESWDNTISVKRYKPRMLKWQIISKREFDRRFE